jgi:carboxylate-amine ligase
LQCVVECITDVCPDVATVRQQTAVLRATAATMAKEYGLALIAAGTHPTGKWYEQHRTAGARYGDLEMALQDVARSILIYSLQVHVNIADQERRIAVMNQVRTYLPHILALSANSPFWMGRNTGYMAFRPMVWAPFPMSGIPDPFADYAAYERFQQLFFRVNSLGATRRMWWDIRPHHVYPTLEFRIADMPIRHEDTVAIVAFIQALVKTILDRLAVDNPLPTLPTSFISENRWRAALGGIHGTLVDFEREREVPTIDALAEAFDLVQGAMEALGTTQELAYLRAMLAPDYRCGAERQLDAYGRNHDLHEVSRLLMQETLHGIDLRQTMPLAEVTHAKGNRWRVRRKSA